MRIGFFTSIDGWGGSETYLRSLMLGVRDRGHEAVLFGIGGTRLMNEMRSVGMPCVEWRQTTALATPSKNSGRVCERRRCCALMLGIVPAWVKLALGLRRDAMHLAALFRPAALDMLHINVHGYEVAGLAARMAGIPSFGMYLTFPHDEPYWFRRCLMRWTIRSYGLVAAQSQACMDAWRKRTDIDRDRTSCIWNSAEVNRFAVPVERPLRRREDVLRVVAVGRLHPMKGFRDLVEAVGVEGDARVRVDILGDGPERSTLEAAISRLGLGGRVCLVGHVEDPERWLRDAHVFALPSVQFESGPAALAEALMAGLPCVTSDFGPLPEMNRDGETGIVVSAGDVKQLGAALSWLADSPGGARRMGEGARCRAMSCFSRSAMVNETLVAFEGVLKGRRT